jgi:ribose 5-phosphate isomerase A
MTQDELKQAAAKEAIKYVVEDTVVGVGTGSTADRFIDELAKIKNRIDGAVASSQTSAERLKARGIRVVDLNSVGELPVYVDGADEVTEHLAMIKGGGGALTREKIVAAVAEKFVCIADESKLVGRLGRFPLPVEVIPMAAAQISRRFAAIGGRAQQREGVVTDNGGVILDIHGLAIDDPAALESEINQWPGVVCVGLFARRRATVCLLGTATGVRTLTF